MFDAGSKEEADFLEAVQAKHGLGDGPMKVVEPACGTGRLVRLGLQDVFPESGDAFGLLDRYGLGVKDIVH